MDKQIAVLALALAALWEAASSTARAAVATGATTLSCAQVEFSASGVG